jgi:hypothetical protein
MNVGQSDIVYVPVPASFERKSDLSKGKILSLSTTVPRGVGVVYKVQLPGEDVDALGDDVKFADEGTEIWATECILSNVNTLQRIPERVKGVREHDCDKLGCSDECEKPKYDYRVKWDGICLDAFYYYLCLATPTIISRAINTEDRLIVFPNLELWQC